MIRGLPGLSFRETMRGGWWRLDAPTEEHTLTLSLQARADDVGVLARDRTFRLHGIVDVGGLASGAEVEGELVFRLFDQGRLPYRVRFRGDDGRAYELSGQKEWLPVAPLASITTLPISVYGDDGAEIGRGMLRFDLRRDWRAWLGSVRVRLFE